MTKEITLGPCAVYVLELDGTESFQGITTGPVTITIGEKSPDGAAVGVEISGEVRAITTAGGETE